MPTVSYVTRRVFPLACSLVLACNSERMGPPLPDQNSLFWDLKLSHHAVTLSMTAPYDTLQLAATPRNFDGEPLTDLPAVTYVSRDPTKIRVTSDGRLVAISPTGTTGQVVVVATVTTVDNLTHKDSVFVRAVDNTNPPVLQTLSVHPIAPDSAKRAAQRFPGNTIGIVLPKLPVRATDANSVLMTNPLVFFHSSDPLLALIHPLTGALSFPLTGGLSGDLNFVGEMTAFGVTKVDTVRYRIGLPIYSEYNFVARKDGALGSIPDERELRVGKGAVIAFKTALADLRVNIDIVFDDPTHVLGFTGKPIAAYTPLTTALCFVWGIPDPLGSDCANNGNIMLRSNFNAAGIHRGGYGARVFPEAGVYDFHSELNGFRSRIVVVDESE